MYMFTKFLKIDSCTQEIGRVFVNALVKIDQVHECVKLKILSMSHTHSNNLSRPAHH